MGLFQTEQTAQGTTGTFNPGIDDIDPGTPVETGLLIGYVKDPQWTWLHYDCHIEIELDPGMVLHKILPQSKQSADSLTTVNAYDPDFDKNTSPCDLESVGDFEDIVQRMATSRYRFCLKGSAIRVAYKIPIPALKTVCGVVAIPEWPQRVIDSKVVANFSGVPVFYSEWELWYFITKPPQQNQLQPPNLAQHIRADAELPDGMQAPWSQPDQDAVPSGGLRRVAPGAGGG